MKPMTNYIDVKKSIFLKEKMIFLIVIFLMLIMPLAVSARIEIIDLDIISNVAIPLHAIEFALSLFICVMALQFFRITKPLNLFMFIYVAIGFFMINSLLNMVFYLMQNSINSSFAVVHLGSRLALIGMALSFVMFFYNWNKVMRKSDAKNK